MASRIRRRNNGLEILPASHVDHGLTKAHLDYILQRYSDRNQFFIETITLPAELPSLTDALYGPANGDAPVPDADVHFAQRGNRPGDSRMIDAPLRPTRKLTVIAGPHEGHPCVLYTAFGGVLTPKEPFDPTLDLAQWAESKEFWSQHALATGQAPAPRSNAKVSRKVRSARSNPYPDPRYRQYDPDELAAMTNEQIEARLHGLAYDEYMVGHPALYREETVELDSSAIRWQRKQLQEELARRHGGTQPRSNAKASRKTRNARRNVSGAKAITRELAMRYGSTPFKRATSIGAEIMETGGSHAADLFTVLVTGLHALVNTSLCEAQGVPSDDHDAVLVKAREQLVALGHPELVRLLVA